MAERKIIYKVVVGSKLYGTDGPDSDTDYAGVFLPSTADLLGLQHCPSEWTFNEKVSKGERNTKEDTDCKFFSVQRFMELAAQGQPGQLELLFVPENKILLKTPEWDMIARNKDFFLSKRGIKPFVGFALSQSYKSTIKGENLNLLRSIQAWGEKLSPEAKNAKLMDLLTLPPDVDSERGKWVIINTEIRVDALKNDFGALLVNVAGRKYDISLKTKTFLANVDELIGRYGSRSSESAAKGVDFKSRMHAARLVSEAKEYLLTGNITLPRPDANYLKEIKAGLHEEEWDVDITSKLDELRELEDKSPLPKEADRSKINKLCEHMLLLHLFEE